MSTCFEATDQAGYRIVCEPVIGTATGRNSSIVNRHSSVDPETLDHPADYALGRGRVRPKAHGQAIVKSQQLSRQNVNDGDVFVARVVKAGAFDGDVSLAQ